ncbi:MAG: hypothetical protein ACRDP8_26845 [Actinopolymorphaceae bacterium]
MPAFTISPEHTRSGGDPRRVAIILPGGYYTPAGPLLHYAHAVLRRHGWTVQELWWDTQDWPGDRDGRANQVCAYATWALDRESGECLIVGKSLGTFAIEVAADRGLPGIWLTPLLDEARVTAALDRATAGPTLLVGGTADTLWDGDMARRSGTEVLEIADADHAMETDASPVDSIDMLRQVVVAIDAFVARLNG